MTTSTALQAKTFAPALTVGDMKRSIQFYTDGLGFTIEEQSESEGEIQFVMLAAGAARIGLGKDDFAKGRDRVKGVGMRFFIETDQDLDALAAQARAAGIEVDGPAPMEWGPPGFAVTDPDGFKLTLAKPA